MKLLVEHVLQHLRLPEPQAQADRAEGSRQANHAQLIGEVAIAVVMMIV
jgi:hypothetical protein